MKVLIIGNGGREHALAWKTAQSSLVTQVFVAPGNAGTALEPQVQNVDIQATDIINLIQFVKANHIDLTIVGPEAPLEAGVVDAFQVQGLRCLGPTQAAARLESSKAFSKDFMNRHQIPTAQYRNFADLAAAKAYIQQQLLPIVVKADGLAAGKGVIIAKTHEEAIAAVEDMLAGNLFGSAGHRVVIEEFLVGEEASFIVLCDGQYALPLATSQDHKARDNGDLGPNTGGMGAYSPAPVITPAIHQQVMEKIIYPTLRGLAEEGSPYTGFLYAGLMITPQNQAKVLEFNCRFGDPETQPIMLRLKSDLVELCLAALEKRLATTHIEWDPRPALGVVLAAAGYPFDYHKGDIIEGIPKTTAPDSKIFHAGTVLKNGKIMTAGGRVLCATALGENVLQAQKNAYALVKKIQWVNQYYRTDIGHRAVAREMKTNEME